MNLNEMLNTPVLIFIGIFCLVVAGFLIYKFIIKPQSLESMTEEIKKFGKLNFSYKFPAYEGYSASPEDLKSYVINYVSLFRNEIEKPIPETIILMHERFIMKLPKYIQNYNKKKKNTLTLEEYIYGSIIRDKLFESIFLQNKDLFLSLYLKIIIAVIHSQNPTKYKEFQYVSNLQYRLNVELAEIGVTRSEMLSCLFDIYDSIIISLFFLVIFKIKDKYVEIYEPIIKKIIEKECKNTDKKLSHDIASRIATEHANLACNYAIDQFYKAFHPRI